MKKFICVSKCPELDRDNSKHCTDTEENINYKKDMCKDYCPCGNIANWKEIKI